ncbi:MAG: DUF835 domain-containing protein [Candidatus Altiarchaeota archaeon]
MAFEFTSKLLLNVFAIVISLVAVVYWIKIYRQLYKKDEREIRGWRWLFVAILAILLFNISSIYYLITTADLYVTADVSRFFPNAKTPATMINVNMIELFNIVGRTIIALSMTMGAYLLYAPMRKIQGAQYRFVPITPVIEENIQGNLKYKISPSAIYLVKEEKAVEGSRDFLIKGIQPKKSLEIFTDLVTHGYPGLCITRMHPKKLREKYNLERTPILWLTQSMEVRGRINPSDLIELSQTVREFVRRTENSVILLDGLEYLITQNNFEEILRLIQSLNDMVSISSATLIVPLDQSTISTQQMHLLEREMNEITSVWKT